LHVTVKVHLVKIAGKRLVFEFEADDGIDAICKGSHERFVINSGKFAEKLKTKMKPV